MSKIKGIILLMFMFCILPGCIGQETETAPNVIFIFPDQYRNTSIGIWSEPEYGKHLQVPADPVKTPALDKLARESVVLSRAVSNFPLCSPYRAMLISGMYPSVNGVDANCRKDRDVSLRSDVKGMTDVFGENGYDVSYFGKIHWLKNDPLFDENGTYVGTTDPPGGQYINNYDTYVPPGPDRHGIDYFYQVIKDVHFDPMVYSNDSKLVEGRKDGELYKPGRFNAEIESEAIIKYLEVTHEQRDKDKPFFMMWSLNPPHNPWNEESTKMEFFDQYTEDGKVNLDKLLTHDNVDKEIGDHAPYYFANVSAVDYYIGKVLDKLEELELADNTIVVFSSDHGEMLGSHGKRGKNVPEMESLNIPFMIKYDGKLKPKVDDLIMSVPDVMPTLLGLAGLEEKIPSTVQGQNFSKILTDQESEVQKPESVLYINSKVRGVYSGDYTFIVENRKGSNVEVFYYDNVKDPFQMDKKDVASMPEGLEEKMKTKLVSMLKQTDDDWYKKKRASSYLKYN
ncbi:MAG: sulfatase [Cyclobacteriaceae bacterium]